MYEEYKEIKIDQDIDHFKEKGEEENEKDIS